MNEIALGLFIFNAIEPLVSLLQAVISFINGVVHGYGWTMIILAISVKLIFWPLNSRSTKSMLRMQRIAPKLKALQAEFRNQPERLNAATVALYKSEGVNPLAGCLPQLVQLPILVGLYWAVIGDKAVFASQSWLWIGSAAARRMPGHLLAANLAASDFVLLALYVVSMYFSVKSSSAPSDPQSAKQQQIMAIVSPGITGYLGFRYAWPSTILIYWVTSSVIAICQQRYLIWKCGAPVEIISQPLPTPAWLLVSKAYVLFLLGRGYSEVVNIGRARWIAWASLTASIFAFTMFGGADLRVSAADGGSLNLLLRAITLVSLYAMILKLRRGSVTGF